MKILKIYFKKVLIILALISISSTYFIGSYFVNYALVAKSGGENRTKKSLILTKQI